MSMRRDTVTVRVPGSTSNCGSGFDTLGLALSIYNRVTLTRSSGDSAEPDRVDDGRAQTMVAEAAALYFKTAGRPAEGFRYRIEGDVPAARGLGSSVTVIGGVLAGLDALHGTKWSRHKLVELATALEGHPDNASAGILGGFCAARCDPKSGVYLDVVRVAVPATLEFVVVSPVTELLTKESRGMLPASVAFFDAVKSINSAASLNAAFASGDFEKLRYAAGDFMHEPYRLPKIPGATAALAAGQAAGAYTGWLSGSGSSVLCVCPQAASKEVATAMRQAFATVPVSCSARILWADNEGLKLD
jgi:homoserine kinase